ncbi:MAG: hypothetical protein VSS75_013495 [Candidatus Parabeggiatoa sp.]
MSKTSPPPQNQFISVRSKWFPYVYHLSTEPQINRYFTEKICSASRLYEIAKCRDARHRVSTKERIAETRGIASLRNSEL